MPLGNEKIDRTATFFSTGTRSAPDTRMRAPGLPRGGLRGRSQTAAGEFGNLCKRSSGDAMKRCASDRRTALSKHGRSQFAVTVLIMVLAIWTPGRAEPPTPDDAVQITEIRIHGINEPLPQRAASASEPVQTISASPSVEVAAQPAPAALAERVDAPPEAADEHELRICVRDPNSISRITVRESPTTSLPIGDKAIPTFAGRSAPQKTPFRTVIVPGTATRNHGPLISFQPYGMPLIVAAPVATNSAKPAVVSRATAERAYFPAASPRSESQYGSDKRLGLFEVIAASEEFSIGSRRSKLLRTRIDVVRTAVTDPAICEVVQHTPREISIIGKDEGVTDVTFWFDGVNTRPTMYLVRVCAQVESQSEMTSPRLATSVKNGSPAAAGSSKSRTETY